MSSETEQANTDEAALKMRLQRLRAFSEGIAAHMRTLTLPETYLEAMRAARALTVMDRVLVSLPEAEPEPEAEIAPSPEANTTSSLRLCLRSHADRLMEAADFIPLPDSYIEGERASRYALAAERMVRQLYSQSQTGAALPNPDPYRDKEYELFWADEPEPGARRRLPSDPDFRIDNPNCIPLPGEEGLDTWEIIRRTFDEREEANWAAVTARANFIHKNDKIQG